MARNQPATVVANARRKVIAKLKADRAKVEAQMKAKLAEYDAMLAPEEAFLRELEKIAEPQPTAGAAAEATKK